MDIRLVYEIKFEDINKSALKYVSCSACGKTATISVGPLMGRIMKCDVGKRIYLVNSVYRVESNDQLKERRARA